MATLSLAAWKDLVLRTHPTASFTEEDGSGQTHGDVGEWTAWVGPDAQSDVVGVFVPGDFCSVYGDGTLTAYTEYDAE